MPEIKKKGRPSKADVSKRDIARLRRLWVSDKRLPAVMEAAQEIHDAIDANWMKYRFGRRTGPTRGRGKAINV